MEARTRSVFGWIRRCLGSLGSPPARVKKRPAHSPSLFDSLERREVLSTTIGPFVTIPAAITPINAPTVVSTTTTTSSPYATSLNPPASITAAVATPTAVVGKAVAATPSIVYGQPVVQGSLTVKASAIAPPSYPGQPVVPVTSSGISATALETDYVQSLYHDVLNRTGRPDEVAKWVGIMNSGLSYQGVAEDFVNSAEHRWNEVDSYYQEFLHRTPDRLASVWVDELLAGASEESVSGAILDSSEYQQAHASADQFVEGLYQDVLGRQPQAGEVAVWESDLASGLSRPQVVSDFVNSTEAVDQVIEGYYAQFLHRLPDSTASSPWADLLKPGGSATRVAVGILSSPEFVQNSTRP